MRSANIFIERFSVFENFFGRLKTERNSVTLNYIIWKIFHTFHPHFPGKFGYGIPFFGRSVEGRVVEGKIVAKVNIFLDHLETVGLRAISESANENKTVFGVLSEKLLDSIIYVFWPVPKSCFWGFDGEENVVDLIDFVKQFFKLIGYLIIDLDSGGVSKARSVDDSDVEFVLNVIDIVFCYQWCFARSSWLFI